MAIESIRGCGFRFVNAVYLCGSGLISPCDRPPIVLEACPTCGSGDIGTVRAPRKIQPLELLGEHLIERTIPDESGTAHSDVCDEHPICVICNPSLALESAYILGVGKRYYSPSSFIDEVKKLGVSKRIGFIPKEMKLGESWVYLTHPEAGFKDFEKHEWEGEIPKCVYCQSVWHSNQSEAEKGTCKRKVPAVFYAFRPERFEMLLFKKDATPEKIEELEKRGITVKLVENDDKDHLPAKSGGPHFKKPKLKEPPKPKGQTTDEFTKTLG